MKIEDLATYIWPGIFKAGTFKPAMNTRYVFRSAMTWKPPFSDMIYRLTCFRLFL